MSLTNVKKLWDVSLLFNVFLPKTFQSLRRPEVSQASSRSESAS